MDALGWLNQLSPQEAKDAFFRCCGSILWAAGMVAGRPFASEAALFACARELEERLSEADWKETFTHHPKIGDLAALREKFESTAAWAGSEQAGVDQASEETLLALAKANQQYEDRFGYIFIVCATGKSASEILEIVKERLEHEPEEELTVAAGEQARITELRLKKMLARSSPG